LRLFQAIGWRLLRISVGPALLCLASVSFTTEYALPRFLVTDHPEVFQAQIGEAMVTFALLVFIAGPVFLTGVAATVAGVTVLVSDYILGNVPDERLAQRRVVEVLPRLFVLSFRDAFIQFGGFLFVFFVFATAAYLGSFGPQYSDLSGWMFMFGCLAIIPAVIFFLYNGGVRALTPSVLILEDLGIREASKRSKYLAKARDPRGTGQFTLFQVSMTAIFLMILLEVGIYAMKSILGLDAQLQSLTNLLPFPALWQQAIDLVPIYLALWFTIPFIASAATLLYYDRRIRFEGYDIEVLASEIATSDRQVRFRL
jgi:hypothetical protein